MIDLIYCADGNARFAQIAIDHGYKYGAQVPGTLYFEPYFVDQDWKNPVRERYVKAVAEYRPRIATVLDLEREEQLQEVLGWAEDVAPFVEAAVIIPKAQGIVARLPREIGGAEVRLGYSVPSKYSGTELPIWDFVGWPVHLLGGSPRKQMELARYMDVRSADGNYMLKMATRYCMFSVPDGSAGGYATNRWWPTLKEASNGELWGDGSETADAPYEAFRRSCKNVMAAWKKVFEIT